MTIPGVAIAVFTVWIVEVSIPALVACPSGIVGLAGALSGHQVADVTIRADHVTLAGCKGIRMTNSMYLRTNSVLQTLYNVLKKPGLESTIMVP